MSKCENPTDQHIKMGIMRNKGESFASVALLRSRFGYAYMSPTRTDVTRNRGDVGREKNIGISKR